MNSKMTITIRRRSQTEWLIWLIILMPFMFATVFELMALPKALKFLLDFSWACLLLFLFLNFSRNADFIKECKILYTWFFWFIIFTLLAYVFNFQSVFYYLWGARNNFRFFVFFFACTAFLRPWDATYYLALFDKVFWVNAVVSVVQYFVFGIYGDKLGGLFGVEFGCNSYTNLFFIIISLKSIIYCLNKKESVILCVVKSVVMIVIAAFAELKFFYVEYVIIIALSILITEFSWRKLFFIIGAVGIMFLGMYVLAVVFPDSMEAMTLEVILDRASSETGYTTSGDVNRLTAIPVLSRRFLTTLPDKLFGLGLGNCDTSTFAICNTPFYQQYAQLHYTWFTAPMIFLEMGYIGLGLYFLFFVLCIRLTWRRLKSGEGDKLNCQIAILMAVLCMILMFYNSSLRVESAYMMYFVLALPFLRSNASAMTATTC